MREIKFRGKRMDNGEWLYGDLMHVNEQVLINPIFNEPYEFDGDLDANVHPETVGQYTGLHDRNGKGREMYEGDVYKQDGRYYVIEWYETKCAFIIRSLTSGSILPGHLEGEVSIYDDYEYIGSIYEHPELRKVREG